MIIFNNFTKRKRIHIIKLSARGAQHEKTIKNFLKRKVLIMTTKKEKLAALFPEDLYMFSDSLTDGEVEVLVELKESLEKHLRPVITEHTEKAKFPFEAYKKVTDEVKFLDDDRLYPDPNDKDMQSQFYFVFLYYLLARFDTSIATFTGVHGGLGYFSLLFGGSEEQKKEWLPKLRTFELQTCFALTEPEHGSDIAGGLSTTATRDGDKWILNGEKRWIGGASSADIIPVYARDTEDKQIKCFVVKKGQEGLEIEDIQHKNSLRMVNNGHIYLKDVEVLEADRLPKINSFKDVAKILYATRALVGSLATGLAAGSYEAALKYTSNRTQFGKKLTEFQLIQEKLTRMQANVTANLGMIHQLAVLQSEGKYDEVRSSVAKLQTSLLSRQTVALGREVCGGNGIVLDYDVARFFQDAEAIYTYEGTHEVNALVIGRAITGKAAFV